MCLIQLFFYFVNFVVISLLPQAVKRESTVILDDGKLLLFKKGSQVKIKPASKPEPKKDASR